MKEYLEHIDKQIEGNRGKNIFYGEVPLRFVEDTIKAIAEIYENSIEHEDLLIDYATDKALEEFCRINQYYSFGSQAKKELRSIYSDLFLNIKANTLPLDQIEKNHYQKLKQWLSATNSFAEKLYANTPLNIEPVPCSEYTPEMQLNLLGIYLNTLMEPVLDIGCGQKGNLVTHLSKLGFDVVGIDRYTFLQDNCITADWLEFNYGTCKWGTVLSNLGFSNHFYHHNLREDGQYIEYAKTYMTILKSLKTGGCFHYAPDLPFIETYLDMAQYDVDKFVTGKQGYKTSVIKRVY